MSVEDLSQQLASLSVRDDSLEDPYIAMLKQSDTYEDEHQSPIMLRAHGFLEAEQKRDNFESMYRRAMQWCQDVGVNEQDIAHAKSLLEKQIQTFDQDKSAKFEHIFVRDSERALNHPKRRKLLCHILTVLRAETLDMDYHQGLSIICAYLMLFLDSPRVIAMIIKANTIPHYIPGVWKAESVVAVANGYTLHRIFETDFPEIHDLLKETSIIPELYASKFWCALGIHVLPFQSLALFFDDFWKHGTTAVYRLVIRLFLRRYQLMKANPSIDKILEYIRMDPLSTSGDMANEILYNLKPEVVSNIEDEVRTAVPEDGIVSPTTASNPENGTSNEGEEAKTAKSPSDVEFNDIVKRVDAVLESWNKDDKLAKTRQSITDETLLKRIERANEEFAQSTPNCASKADCKDREGTGYYYCLNCKIHLCEDCAYGVWDDHNDDDHDVRVNEEVEELNQ